MLKPSHRLVTALLFLSSDTHTRRFRPPHSLPISPSSLISRLSSILSLAHLFIPLALLILPTVSHY